MENANANVKRIDIILLKEFKNIAKKNEKVGAVFLICIKHYSKARNRDFSLIESFHLIVFTCSWPVLDISKNFLWEFIELTEFNYTRNREIPSSINIFKSHLTVTCRKEHIGNKVY